MAGPVTRGDISLGELRPDKAGPGNHTVSLSHLHFRPRSVCDTVRCVDAI